tara:strand:+ start:78 stop:230 length:153 start_codon:yes stop_codon:yes gene_type:complete
MGLHPKPEGKAVMAVGYALVTFGLGMDVLGAYLVCKFALPNEQLVGANMD